MCQIGQKREKRRSIRIRTKQCIEQRGQWSWPLCVSIEPGKKTLAFSFVHSTATDHSRETRNSNCNRFFFTLDNNRKKFGEKKNAANFFRLLILKANCWRQQRCSRKKRHDKTAGETKRNEWTINYGWNELNIGNKPLCVVSLPSYAVTVLTDGDRRRATAPVQQWNVERIVVALSLIRRWYALY